MKDKISGLILLQKCDNRIKGVDAKKREGPVKIQRLENEFRANDERLKKEYDQLESFKKDRRLMEQEIQDLENKAEKSQVKLSIVKSNKEYTAVLKEIEGLNKEKTQMEDKVLQLMEEIEELEKKCIEDGKEQERMKKKFEEDKAEIEKVLEKLDRESATLEKQRIEYSKAIDQDLLKRYLFLKERKGGLAIGSVVGSVCQACNMEIPPQQFNQLIKGQSLLSCPNCNRLIYWGEDEFFQEVLDKA